MSRAARRQLIQDMLAAFEAAGHPVTCARVAPDLSIELLTGERAAVVPSNENEGDWTDLAGETEVSRAEGA